MPVIDLTAENNKISNLDFEKIYHKYCAYVRYLTLKILHNHCDAEDAVQEVWETIAENMHIFDIGDDAAHRVYIAEVVKGKSIDVQRKRQRQDRLNADADPHVVMQMVAGTGRDSGLYELWANGVWRALDECIASMKAPLCDILHYYYVENLTVKEIAEKLNMNVKTVYTRIERGRPILAQLMKAKGIEPI